MAVELTSLKGIGHFTLWFLIGYLVLLIASFKKPDKSRIHVWGPFLPFVLGTIAAIPYALQMVGLISREAALQPVFLLMLLYPITEQSSLAHSVFRNFHLNMVLLGLAYMHLILRYINQIKRLRKTCFSTDVNRSKS
jgi:uncharacterized membrane protein